MILLVVGILVLLAAIVAIFGLVGMGVSVLLWMIFYIIVGVGFIEYVLPRIDLVIQMIG